MQIQGVHTICKYTPVLLRNVILEKIVKTGHTERYNPVAGLFLFIADYLVMDGLQSDTVRLLLEEFHDEIEAFGVLLGKALVQDGITDIKKLPVCKIGILDGKYACVDGKETMLDLQTGLKVTSLLVLPLRTTVYNLTGLLLKYRSAYQETTGK